MPNKNEPTDWQNAQLRYLKPRGYIVLTLGLLIPAFIILRLVVPSLTEVLFFAFSMLIGISGRLFFSYTRQIRAVKHTIEKSYPYDIQTTADAIAHILQKKPVSSEKLRSRNGYNFFVDDCAIVIRVRHAEFEHNLYPHPHAVVSIRPALPVHEPLINSLTEKIDNALSNPLT